MNVIIANKYQTLLSTLEIEVMKTMYGDFEVDEIIDTFQNFFYSRMILDVTAIKNYKDIKTLQKLSISLDMSKIILLLDDSTESNSSSYLSQLISMGIYNFTTTIDGVRYLLNSPNTYRDVAHLHQLEVSTPNEVQASPAITDKKRRIIAIKNVTQQAGATTLVYMMKKYLEKNYDVLAVEIDKIDFGYFKDNELISIKSDQIGNFLAKYESKEVILVDINKSDIAEPFMTDIIYLIEPSIIKLNRLMQINPVMIPKLKGKKVILNKSLLNSQDVMEFEYESRLNILYNLPPIDDRSKDSEVFKKFLIAIGFHRVNSSDFYNK